MGIEFALPLPPPAVVYRARIKKVFSYGEVEGRGTCVIMEPQLTMSFKNKVLEHFVFMCFAFLMTFKVIFILL